MAARVPQLNHAASIMNVSTITRILMERPIL